LRRGFQRPWVWRCGRSDMKKITDYINLLPREEKPARMMNAWVLSFALFLALWIAVFGATLMERRNLLARQASLAAQGQALNRQLTALQKELGLTSADGMTAEKAALVKNLLGERVLWSEVFKKFSLIVPRGMWFDSLEGSAAGSAEIKIRGGALNYDAVSRFMLAMQTSSFFDKPQLSFAQKTVVRGRDAVGFEIICGIRKGQGAP